MGGGLFYPPATDGHFSIQGINEHVNFDNFGNALVLLIRTATLDNWFDILQVCYESERLKGCQRGDIGSGRRGRVIRDRI